MGVPHGILRVFNTISYENEFQNPQIFQQTISLFPDHSTLACDSCDFYPKMDSFRENDTLCIAALGD
jgi:hypothetical protein